MDKYLHKLIHFGIATTPKKSENEDILPSDSSTGKFLIKTFARATEMKTIQNSYFFTRHIYGNVSSENSNCNQKKKIQNKQTPQMLLHKFNVVYLESILFIHFSSAQSTLHIWIRPQTSVILLLSLQTKEKKTKIFEYLNQSTI